MSYHVIAYYDTGYIQQCEVADEDGVRWMKQTLKDAGFPVKVGVMKETTKQVVIEEATYL